MDVDALHRRAGLTGGEEALGRARQRRVVHVGIGVDKHRAVAAQLQNAVPQPDGAPQVLAHDFTAGEGVEVDARVLQQCLAHVRADQHIEKPRGQPRLGEDQVHQQRADGRGLRRLEYDRVARTECRRDLVRDEVQRRVARRDRHDDADGLTQGDRVPPDAVRSRVERRRFAADPLGLFSGPLERLDGSPNLVHRSLAGLSAFDHQRLDEGVPPRRDSVCRGHQDLVAAVRGSGRALAARAAATAASTSA